MHPQSETIELWCNGNTTDSGPVFPGSSPGSSTEKVERNVRPFSFSPASLRPETIVRPTAIEFLVLLLQRHLPATPPATLGLHLPPSALPLCSTPAPLLCNIPTSQLNSPLLHSFYTPDFTTQLPHLLHSFYTPCFTTLLPPCSATPRHEPESAHYADLRADATPFASGCRSCTPQRLYP